LKEAFITRKQPGLSLDNAAIQSLAAQVAANVTVSLQPQLDRQQMQLNRIEAKLDTANQGIEKIMADEAVVIEALTKIDAATTKIAGNVQTIATLDQTVSDEMDALIAGMKAQGVSQALIDQATATSAKAQAASDASDALVPVLQAIAAKGVQNPVPVPVPAPVAA